MDKNKILNEVNKLVSAGLRKTALDLLEEFIEKSPDEPATLRALGRIYLLEKQPEKAVKYLQLSLKHQQTNSKTPIEEPYLIDSLGDEDFLYLGENAESGVNNQKYNARNDYIQLTGIETDNTGAGVSNHIEPQADKKTKTSESPKRIRTESDDLGNRDHSHQKPLIVKKADKFDFIESEFNTLLKLDSPTEKKADLFHNFKPLHEENNIQLDLFDEEILVDDFIEDTLENEEDGPESIDEIYSDDQEEKLFSWDDVDEFDDIDDEEQLPEFYTHDIETNGKLSRRERAKQIAVEVIKEYDWGRENLPLMQQVFYENGWATARRSIERELSKGLTAEELTLALYIRSIWTESEQYWISFIHVKSNQTGQWTRAAYKNMSWPESLRIIRSFNSLPSEEEIQYFIDETYDDWICSARLQKNFKAFIRYLKFRTGSVRGSLPGNELFSFINSYANESFLDQSYEFIKTTPGIEELGLEGVDIGQSLLDIEQEYAVIKPDGDFGDPDVYGDFIYQ